MKTYHLSFLVETESDTDYQNTEVFTDLKTAQKEFKKAVKNAPRYRQSNDDDFREYLTESIVLEEWIDDDFENTLMQQTIYSEGVIDRNNYKGDYPSYYWFKARFNGKELVYRMYYENKLVKWGNKLTVKESELPKWYR